MWWGIAAFFVCLFVAMLMCIGGDHNGDPDAEHCIDWHRRNGQYRVLYPDGFFSQPFTWAVACDYQKIFGGRVVPKEAYGQSGSPSYKEAYERTKGNEPERAS